MYSDIKVRKNLRTLIEDLYPENIEQSDIMISGIETNSKMYQMETYLLPLMEMSRWAVILMMP